MKTTFKTGLACILLLLTFSCRKENGNLQSSVSDNDASYIDAGKYAVVSIGNQKWMLKNLDVTHYRNGDRIPQVKDPTQWANLTTGAWCWYNNDSAFGAIYGRLYNWYAVNDPRGLAPTGWHISSNEEWDTLSLFLANRVGGQLKDTGTIEAGTGLWYAPNSGATNESGFTGLPGGYHGTDGVFYAMGYSGYWWNSAEYGTLNAWYSTVHYTNRKLVNAYAAKGVGLSVRCIKN